MNRKTKIIVFVSIAVLILGIAFFPKIKQLFISGNQDDSSAQRTPTSGTGRSALMVNATVLTPQTLNNMFRMTGILLPDEKVDLTFESSGKITNIYIE